MRKRRQAVMSLRTSSRIGTGSFPLSLSSWSTRRPPPESFRGITSSVPESGTSRLEGSYLSRTETPAAAGEAHEQTPATATISALSLDSDVCREIFHAADNSHESLKKHTSKTEWKKKNGWTTEKILAWNDFE